MLDLFADEAPWQEPLAPGAVVLRRFAFRAAQSLLDDIGFVASQSPFRQMVTPGGYTMSVAMTNCGALGWTTDRHGYCYAVRDPLTDNPGLRCRYRLPAYVVRRQSRQGMRASNRTPA